MKALGALRLSAAAAALALMMAAQAREASAEDLYVKKGTWQETMLAVRARYAAWARQGAGELEALLKEAALGARPPAGRANPLPVLWARIGADFPAEAKRFAADLGRGCRPTEWFRKAGDTQLEQRIIRQVLAGLGKSGEGLRADLAGLVRLGEAPDSRAWLDLYVKACRRRALLEAIGEVEKSLPDPSALRAAVEALGQALPGRFAGGPRLIERLADCGTRRARLLGAIKQGAETGEAATAMAAEIAALRRQVRLGLCGVQQYVARRPGLNLEQEWDVRLAVLRRPPAAPNPQEAYHPEALPAPADRDPADMVLRRAAALAADLGARAAALGQELAELRRASGRIDPADAEARRALFYAACKVRREIALRNPLLDFEAILFIKRHRATYNHMCDQYYGINALPGGGLYVLSDPFGCEPRLRDVLAESVVQRGRLKGQKLEGGSFLSPDLSCDGRSILFAYVECTGDRGHRWHTDVASRGYWSQGRCYHVFSVGADGTGLAQLTDGTWNDFDPCWLPNGRIAFISERRGGYLRCGRTCPTYTLHDMAADGGDIRRLSPHETNEWHPSVTHDGLIVYTRWDYVDRHGCTAHLPWVTTLDGRDSRAVHGNFAPRRSRPDMEVDVRAIPGSRKLVATAAPHHGQAFGSLVIIDPDVEDDDRLAPVKRLTPDVGFPESQGGRQAYGTAWPLGEKYHLCVYDPLSAVDARRGGFQGRADWQQFHYALYLVDAFGNKVLIYRDREIGCLSPIPLRSRAAPPVMPAAVTSGTFVAASGPAGATAGATSPEVGPAATMAVMDVYDGLKPWPAGTTIKAIRVLQLLPMTVPSGGPPHEIGLRLPSAGDSVTPARYVLGTAPVEPDGSAYFRLPANIEVFFQALDGDGLAVQSMRSATYVKPGERLVCQGCHDRRHRSPPQRKAVGLALRRAPSPLTPDVDGSNPFSYPRLVQPVLEKRCLPCHAKNKGKAPDLGRQVVAGRGRSKWYASYASLAPKYGFWNYHDGYRTTPGRFGARASKLYQMLREGHHKVKLSAEEMHRIALWLDCCSVFYGVYEADGGAAQLAGDVVLPSLE